MDPVDADVGVRPRRHPPNNGLGSNTGIGDAYNLAWKLHLACAGLAGPGLLTSYDAERAPIAAQVVRRANTSIAETGRIITALGVDDSTDEAAWQQQLRLRSSPCPRGEALRENVREAIAGMAHQLQAHGVEMNQRYDPATSSAVLDDGTAYPPFTRDPELFAAPTTHPGAKVPHVWVTRGQRPVSTLDLLGGGAFTVVTGTDGGVWAHAAQELRERTGVPIRTVVIGPGRHVEDSWGYWAEDSWGYWAASSEIDDGGVLLVRPDMHVAARSHHTAADRASAHRWLSAALEQVLAQPLRTVVRVPARSAATD